MKDAEKLTGKIITSKREGIIMHDEELSTDYSKQITIVNSLGISVYELFNMFTADIIKAKRIFIR